VKEHFLTER